MAGTITFPRHLILVGAAVFGVLLALGVHILGQRFGLNLGDLWTTDAPGLIPATAAIAWWLIAATAFVGGFMTASLMHSAVSGQIPRRMRHFLIGVGVLLLAAAGQAAYRAYWPASSPWCSAPSWPSAGRISHFAANEPRLPRRAAANRSARLFVPSIPCLPSAPSKRSIVLADRCR
jgi:hypothetical protein